MATEVLTMYHPHYKTMTYIGLTPWMWGIGLRVSSNDIPFDTRVFLCFISNPLKKQKNFNFRTYDRIIAITQSFLKK